MWRRHARWCRWDRQLVVDCIDDEGIFRGGAIAAGLQMGAKALHEFTAQLPVPSLTPPVADVPFGPLYAGGRLTWGLYAGAQGDDSGIMLERYATAAAGSWPHVVSDGRGCAGVCWLR